jgi:HD-GYP domain-containing protein (c-di-GMP phosphodiesterase class II)
MGCFVEAMSRLVEIRDPYTAGHQHRVADLARRIAIELGLAADRIESVRLAAQIHDLGKIYVPAEILNKPGKLEEMEFSLIQIHPRTAYDILRPIDFELPIADIILQHHEKMNGSGYPHGLKSDDRGDGIAPALP